MVKTIVNEDGLVYLGAWYQLTEDSIMDFDFIYEFPLKKD